MSKLDTPEAQAAKEAEREIQRLKKENEELKLANSILKDVAKLFSNDRLVPGSKRSVNSKAKIRK